MEKIENLREEYVKCLKPAGEISNTLVFRPLAFPFVLIGKVLNLSPNLFTFFSGIFQLLSAFFFLISESPQDLLYAGFFLFIKQVIDCVDGSLARNTKKSSDFGAILDTSIDTTGMIIMILAISINQFFIYDNPIFFLFMILFFISFSFQCHIHADVRFRYIQLLNHDSDQDFYVNFKIKNETDNPKINFIQKIASDFLGAESWLLRRIAPIPNIKKYREHKNYEMVREDFSRKYKAISIMWSVVGGSTTIVWFIVLALFNEIIWIWFISIVANNIFIIVFGFLQQKYTALYEKKLKNSFS